MVLFWRTGPPDSTEAQRRIVVCNAEDLPKWEGIGKEIWPNVFPFPGEVVHWTEYSLPHNEFPTVDEVKAADLLIMGGSHYSAYEDLAWIHRYAQLIPQYVATGTRMLACCFGHQILAKAMGGEALGCWPAALATRSLQRPWAGRWAKTLMAGVRPWRGGGVHGRGAAGSQRPAAAPEGSSAASQLP
ncbi:glutamine amidotransferase type-1 domain-containing protein [Haematococcus lacustris]|uniref:Glutamine amidotransferase type-1 domain-containing protein n=1 Tax=Haematococcus lacustris TaxID=44745 RepID=A0A699Z8F4_HAELA|nr:glutamine amidotransferase type-1 domain-containing protein [Haematococcus lacustris]